MRTVSYTNRFKRDYRRERSGQHGKNLASLLMAIVTLLAVDTPLPHSRFDHALWDWGGSCCIVLLVG